jgi:uncharacterized protein YqjF (DUF2071 family)
MSSSTLATPTPQVGAPGGGRTPFLTAAWRHLIFANFEAKPEHLTPSLPPGIELDLHEGRAFVSLVGLRFIRTKVVGVLVPFLGAFDRVNLRFYVTRRMANGESRRGVVFLRELVPQSVLAFAARLALKEPFEMAALRSSVPYGGFDATGSVEYCWRLDDRWHSMEATTKGKPSPPEPASLTSWLAHRLWSYARQPDGSTLEFELEHPRWRVWNAERAMVRPDAGAIRLAPALAGKPLSVFVADGSAVRAFNPVGFRLARA